MPEERPCRARCGNAKTPRNAGGVADSGHLSRAVRCRRLQIAITWRTPMPDTTCHMSISLDGFVAGPDQSRENPLGKRGREVHSWHLGDERANDADATAEGWRKRPRGAYAIGRNMFGPIRGEWDADWDGWWGSEPPYHAPVFVLTHHRSEERRVGKECRSRWSPY